MRKVRTRQGFAAAFIQTPISYFIIPISKLTDWEDNIKHNGVPSREFKSTMNEFQTYRTKSHQFDGFAKVRAHNKHVQNQGVKVETLKSTIADSSKVDDTLSDLRDPE